ncbi:MAG: hypothetical protein AAFR84_15930 [Pseudomonadota bacterium]
MKIFGFTIKMESDLLAAAAFLISGVTITAQIYILLAGPEPELVDDFYLTLKPRQIGSDEEDYVSIVAPISVLNTSSAEAPLLLFRVRANVRTEGVDFWLNWHNQIGHIDREGEHHDVSSVTPAVIPRYGVYSQLVEFLPERAICSDCDRDANFVLWSELADAVSTQHGAKVTVDFVASYGGDEESSEVLCTLEINTEFIEEASDGTRIKRVCRR